MDSYKYVILGGGMVAGYASQALVERGVRPGELAVISADSDPPYERPPLSKGFLAGRDEEADLFINSPDFYHTHGIELRLGTPVTAVDLAKKLLHTGPGPTIGYERLLIATGARARRLAIPGADLPGVHYLRSLADARALRTAASGARRAVVLGAGFIGMEVAAALAGLGVETALAFPGERVWERLFTPSMSTFFQGYYEARGVRLLPHSRADAFTGRERLTGVRFSDGRELPADLVVAGVGAVPAVEALADSGLTLADGVLVNASLETSEADVYAAGDVANYEDLLFGRRRRVEHWDNAVEQARHVAAVLTGERTPFVHVPYFFSDVFDLSYEVWGDATGADRVAYRGDVASDSFSAWWLRGERLLAAFIMNRPDEERERAPEAIAGHASLPDRFLSDQTAVTGVR
jgi:NADPH-dependent 2,4-dienoyl-CoA reductase/sulfur reductase-like enzyme